MRFLRISNRLLLCIRMLAVAALLFAPPAIAETWLHDQIAQHEQQLAQARQAHDLRAQGVELNSMGRTYNNLAQHDQASRLCERLIRHARPRLPIHPRRQPRRTQAPLLPPLLLGPLRPHRQLPVAKLQ